MSASPLSLARAAAEGARAAFTSTKASFHRAQATAALAAGAARDERIQKGTGPWGGAPRRAANAAPLPPTELEVAAEAARKKADAAENAFLSAQFALAAAEAELLRIENAILNAHRDALAVRIRAAQRNGDARGENALLEELRVLCPPDSCVRINQRFRLSLSVRELLDDQGDVMRVDVPVNILRGESHLGYEARREEILQRSESENSTAQAVA